MDGWPNSGNKVAFSNLSGVACLYEGLRNMSTRHGGGDLLLLVFFFIKNGYIKLYLSYCCSMVA